ncbi:MAG: amidohydrolase family protein [Rhodospirillales bacterium]|nr:amidohydrolase family protein [Rhodospirillales bacterium]
MTQTLFTGGRLLDPAQDQLRDGMEILIEDGLIREVSDRPIRSEAARRIDLGGRTIMPGLVDAHVHVAATLVNLVLNAELPSSLIALRTGRIMNAMLMRGFTTVRDLAGADLGLQMAVEEGLIEGPRLVICGKGLSQVGGHGDYRTRTDDRPHFPHRLGALCRIVDGVDEVRRAAREEIRAGAAFIKIMANGGVASPTDPIDFLQFSAEEIRATVEEARNARTYVAAHLYTDEAIARAVACGVHSLEHCNLIRPDTAAQAAKAGAIACPTLVAYEGLMLEGEAFGLSAASVAKIETVRRGGLESLQIMRDAGLPMAFGSDLLGQLHKYQSMEFSIRARVLPAAEILRSATLISARLCRMEGRIGTLAAGAFADLLVVDGDPLADIAVLEQPARLAAIMKGGQFFKNTLAQ